MTTQETPTAGTPILLGHRELQRIFPTVAENTVYRWNTDSGGRAKQLPEPFLLVSGTPMWTEGQIEEFAARKSISDQIDRDALEEIRALQQHSTDLVARAQV